MKSKREIPAPHRAALSLLLMAAITLVLPRHIQLIGRVLISWNAGVLFFLALAAFTMMGADPATVRAHAQKEAEGHHRLLAGTVLVGLVSLLAVAFVLTTVQRHEPRFRLHVFLCVATVFTAWLLLQTMFALFYARCYYQPAGAGRVAGGLSFSGAGEPDYWDFLYFSYAIGTAYSTSDTSVESRALRRVVLLQSLVSFVFYTALIGLLMNAIASLL